MSYLKDILFGAPRGRPLRDGTGRIALVSRSFEGWGLVLAAIYLEHIGAINSWFAAVIVVIGALTMSERRAGK